MSINIFTTGTVSGIIPREAINVLYWKLTIFLKNTDNKNFLNLCLSSIK